ncbi:MAG: hypothetical protein AB1490_00745 [Pseudomonadota bacterium]
MNRVTPLLATMLLLLGTGAGYSQRAVTPTDQTQGAERDVHGAPHGSINSPSPHGTVSRQPMTTGGSGMTRGAPINPPTPTDVNQGAERDIHGAPHGSITSPSPH